MASALLQATLWGVYIISLYFAVFWFLALITKGFDHKQPKIIKHPFVTITIPAYNEEKNIQQTMESVLDLNYPKDKFELIVVNDGSKDSTAKVVQNVIRQNPGFNIKLINQENTGKGGAINNGIEAARGEFFVVLDADSYPEKDALVKILPHFENSDVAVVLPTMKVWKPKTLLQKIQSSEYVVNMFYKRIMSMLNCVPVIPGPFSVYRTAVLKEIGGFEPRNLTEDFEITLRFQSKHHKILQLLDPVVWTKAPSDIKGLYKQRNRWFKGTLLNIFRYRSMAFNREYGDYGMMQVPMTMITGFLAIFLLSAFLYYTFNPYIHLLGNLSLVNFDILTLIKNFKLNFSVFDMNFALVFSTMMMTIMSLIVVYFAHRSQKEKVLKHGIVPFATFLLVYYLTMGIFWAGVFVDLLFKKRQKW